MSWSALDSTPAFHRGAPRIGAGVLALCHKHNLADLIHPLSYGDDTQLHLLFPPDEPSVSDKMNLMISAGVQDHHLHLNLAKTELLIFPANQPIHHNNEILGTTFHAPPEAVRNLGITIDDQWTFSFHVT